MPGGLRPPPPPPPHALSALFADDLPSYSAAVADVVARGGGGGNAASTAAVLGRMAALDLEPDGAAASDRARAALAATTADRSTAADAAMARLHQAASRAGGRAAPAATHVGRRPSSSGAAAGIDRARADAAALEAELASLQASRAAARDATAARVAALATAPAMVDGETAGDLARRAAGAKRTAGRTAARTDRSAAAARRAASKAASKPADGEVMVLSSSSDEDEKEKAAASDDDASALSSALASVDLSAATDVASLAKMLRFPATAIARLSPAARAAAARVLGPGRPTDVVATHACAGIDLSRDKAACLHAAQWLNDEVMNLFLALFQDRDVAARSGGQHSRTPWPRCHFMSTFFVAKLLPDGTLASYNYKGVARWTRPAPLKRVYGGAATTPRTVLENGALVIVPVHLGIHWTLAVVDAGAGTVTYMDSLGGDAPAVTAALARWAVDEAADKNVDLPDLPPPGDWKVMLPAVPRQANGCDCGMFALRFAECAARGVPPDFTQADMPSLRLLMAADAARGRVSSVPKG